MTHSRTLEIAVLGSGLAGSILSRILHRQGHRVTLLERNHHPRFALGESSTPLAGIVLERIADRWDIPDLRQLATWERWTEHHSDLRRGLKRGFTFLDSTGNASDPPGRLLVAASPHRRCADSHWRREDVDSFLVRRAREEGVEVIEGLRIEEIESDSSGWRWSGIVDGETRRKGQADFVVDATGGAGALPRALGLVVNPGTSLSTGLLASHFREIPVLEGRPGDPYPAGRAAVHHLIDEGWIYELPFEDGVTSAGLVLDHSRSAHLGLGNLSALDESLLDTIWHEVTRRSPAVARRFGAAERVHPWITSGRLQRRTERASGSDWALLPATYCFWSPLFSTGIAWSLVAVERLAHALEPAADSRADRVSDYGSRLEREAEHLRRLTEAAYATMDRFDRFHAVALVYFAAASWSEIRQRLADRDENGAPWTGTGFLAAGDPVFDRVLDAIEVRIESPDADGSEPWLPEIRRLLSERDLVGLDQPAAPTLYPADLGVVLDRLDRLKLDVDSRTHAAERLRC